MSNDDFYEDLGNPKTPSVEEEKYMRCQGCGNLFPVSKLRQCPNCGVLLCENCMRKHNCHAESTQSYESSSRERSGNIENHSHNNDKKRNTAVIIGVAGGIVLIAVVLIVVLSLVSFSSSLSSSVITASLSTSSDTTKTTTDNYQTSSTQIKKDSYNIGDVVTIKNSSGSYYTVSITDVLRGDDAYTVINSDREYLYSEPDEGNEFVIYRVEIKNTGSDEISTFNIDFSLFSNGVEQDTSYVPLPGSYPTLSSQKTILPKASASGWLVFETKKGAEITPSFSILLKDDSRVFYTMPTSGSYVTTVKLPEAIPRSGTKNPKFTIKVLKTIKGNDATEIMLDENMINTKPKDGEIAYLINIQASYDAIGTSTNKQVSLYGVSDFALEVDGVDYKSEWDVYPKSHPEFNAYVMNLGDKETGWLYFVVPDNSKSPNPVKLKVIADDVDADYVYP